MKDLTTISSDLFNKIRSRFSDIKIGDETGAITTDPATARFFDVSYAVDGEELGRVNIKIDDDSLTVIYNESMLDDQADVVKDRWYSFLKELRQFARKSLLSFDTRDITKTNLEKRDYEYLAQNTGESSMSESKLFGTSKTSYQDMGEAKIIVKHTQPVNYNLPAGRTQRIESIYIENASGERFKYPSKHLNGARAMAVHVANGGAPYDAIGGYISGLSEELSKLRQFKQYTHRNGVVAEAMGDLTERVAERIDAIKHEITSLQRQSNYESFKESFQVSEAQEVPEETANTWIDALTIKTFNEELKSVFPYIYKLVAEKKEDELRYDDLVSEEVDQEEEEEVEENSMFDEFASKMDEVAALEFEEVVTVEESEEEEESVTENPVAITQEVVEFITSMYDPQAKTFPRGEEGVKIAVEKKFGESAGKFAHYVVEKLSANGQQVQETAGSESEVMRRIVSGELDAYDVLNTPNGEMEQAASEILQQKYEDVAQDHQLHPDDDFEEILDLVVDQLADEYGANESVATEGYKKFGSAWAEELAKTVFDMNPNLNTSGRADELTDIGFKIAVEKVGKKRAQYDFAYDEDFTSDFVSAYGWLQLGGNPETGEDGEEYKKKYGHLHKDMAEPAPAESIELSSIRKLAGL